MLFCLCRAVALLQLLCIEYKNRKNVLNIQLINNMFGVCSHFSLFRGVRLLQMQWFHPVSETVMNVLSSLVNLYLVLSTGNVGVTLILLL